MFQPSSSFFSEAFSGPSNLQFTGQTSDSLRFRWNAAGGPLSGYVVQYVPLSGLGQPLTSELRQVGLRVSGNIPDVQRKTCYLKIQQRQIIVSVATSTLGSWGKNTCLQAEDEPIWWVDLCHVRCSRDESLAGHLYKSSPPCTLAAVFKIVELHVSLCCSLVPALSVYKGHSRLLPAGDCACRSEDLHSTRAEVRDRLPGDHHRSVSQQRGRVCVCQTTNQWVRSRECKSENVQRERPHYMLSFPLYQGLCRGCPAYVWSKQASSLYLWAGIGPRLLCRATDSPSDREVGHTHSSRSGLCPVCLPLLAWLQSCMVFTKISSF